MTKRVTTMTIEPRIIFTPDVTIDNEGIILPAKASGVEPLYALTFVLANQNCDLMQRRASCLSAAAKLITSMANESRFWLLACHTAWQPKTRLMERLRLWKWLERTQVALPGGMAGPEIVREKSDGLRWFGCMALNESQVAPADIVMQAERATFIVATYRSSPSIEDYIECGWADLEPSDMRFWAAMSQTAAAHDSFLLRPFGSFDDREAGVNILGRSRDIIRLKDHLGQSG